MIPKSIEQFVSADVDELLDLAQWFRSRGDNLNGTWLHDVANRYSVIAGAYLGSSDGSIEMPTALLPATPSKVRAMASEAREAAKANLWEGGNDIANFLDALSVSRNRTEESK